MARICFVVAAIWFIADAAYRWWKVIPRPWPVARYVEGSIRISIVGGLVAVGLAWVTARENKALTPQQEPDVVPSSSSSLPPPHSSISSSTKPPLLGSDAIFAQPQTAVVGYVYKLVPDRFGGDFSEPVVGAELRVHGIGNPVRSIQGGFFRLSLPPGLFRPGQQLTVEVTFDGFLLYQPEGGLLFVPEVPEKQPVTVKLLPRGSARFLERRGIASLLRRVMSEVQESQKSAPRPPQDIPPSPVDLKGPMQKWAQEYGLGLQQVQAAVDAWASEVLRRRDRDEEEACLAYYAQRQWEDAARCFHALGQQDVKKLTSLKEQTLQHTEQAVQRFDRAGAAHAARYDYTAALQEYEQAARWAKRDVSPMLWARVQMLLGVAHREVGVRVEGEAVARHLAQAVGAYRAALEVYTRATLPQKWAATQNNLGNALGEQARRTPGETGTALRAQAVGAYRAALEVYTRAALPQEWAMTQTNLSTALRDQALRTEGEAGTALLAEAVAVYRAALEVYTRTALPQEWAMTQNNLGIALWDQALRTDGKAGTALLAQAVVAFRAVLEVHTRAALPQHWAMTQNNLGNALKAKAVRTSGEAGTALLAQAVAAYRAALEVYTRAALPQHWAMTQNNLGNALSDQALRTSGEAGTALLAQAVATFRAALEVRTRAALPQHWAATQNNLGAALWDQSRRTSGEVGTALLAQAVAAFRAALEVRTRAALPQDWATTQQNLGLAFSEQGSRTKSEASTALLAQAVAAFRAALEVRTRAALPQDWAATQSSLGTALGEQARRTAGEAGTALLTQAVAAFRAALEVRTRATLPQDWALTQINLGTTLWDQARRTPGDGGRALLAQSIAAFRSSLAVGTEQTAPLDWAQTQRNLASACAALGDDRCAAQAFAEVLRVFPESQEAFAEAYGRYHEKLFDFAQAFALNKAWLARHPEDLAVLRNFAENHLTTGRFAEVPARVQAVWARSSPVQRVPLAVIEIAALTGLGRVTEASATRKALRTLVAAQPANFQINKSFAGTQHYLSTEPRLAPHRAALLTLVSAIEKQGRAAILAALDNAPP